MEKVGAMEGIRYGFSIIGYLFAVGLVAFVIVFIGGVIMGVSSGGVSSSGHPLGTLVGGLIVLVGIVIGYAGGLGILYKVITDAVARGNQIAADRD